MKAWRAMAVGFVLTTSSSLLAAPNNPAASDGPAAAPGRPAAPNRTAAPEAAAPAENGPAFELLAKFKKAAAAKEQHTGTAVADKMVALRDGAEPIMQHLIAFLRTMPDAKTMEGTEFSFRRDAARVLGSIGAPAAFALAHTIVNGEREVSKSEYASLNGEIVPTGTRFSYFEDMEAAFEAIAFEGGPAIPVLKNLLEHPDAAMRTQAVRCLGRIGLPAAETAPLIRRLTGDPDATCRSTALRALFRVEPEAKSLIPDLKSALRDPDQNFRKVALRCLPMLGDEANVFGDELLDLLEKTDLDPEDLRQGEGSILFKMSGFGEYELGMILRALGANGASEVFPSKARLNSPAQYSRFGRLLINHRGKINHLAVAEIVDFLKRGGIASHEIAREIFLTCPEADKESSVNALDIGLRLKPLPEDLLPEMIERTLRMWKETQFVKAPATVPDSNSYGLLREGQKAPSDLDLKVRRLTAFLFNLDDSGVPTLYRLARAGKVPEEIALDRGSSSPGQLSEVDREWTLSWMLGRLDVTKPDRASIREIGEWGPLAARAVPTLERIVQGRFQSGAHSYSEVGSFSEAITALIRITGQRDEWLAKADAAYLEPALRAGDVKEGCLNYFFNISELGPGSQPYLLKKLSHPDEIVSGTAAEVLMHRNVVVPDLVRYFTDHPMKGREAEFAMAVVRAGGKPLEAWPQIKKLLQSIAQSSGENAGEPPGSKFENVLYAATTIGLAGQPEVEPVLVDLYQRATLTNERQAFGNDRRLLILRLLRDIGADLGPLAKVRVPVLTEALRTYSERESALRELALFGPYCQWEAAELLRDFRLGSFGADEWRVLRYLDPRDLGVRSLLHRGGGLWTTDEGREEVPPYLE